MGGFIQSIIFKDGSESLETKLVPESFFDFKIKNLKGELVNFNSFRDKKVFIVVNVACKWGLTSANYKAMSKMYDELH